MRWRPNDKLNGFALTVYGHVNVQNNYMKNNWAASMHMWSSQHTEVQTIYNYDVIVTQFLGQFVLLAFIKH